MSTVRIRLIGSDTDANTLITVLHGVDGIEHIEEVAELMPNEDDDSSSCGLSDVGGGAGLHEIEVEVPDRLLADRVREVAAIAADLLETNLEFVDEF